MCIRDRAITVPAWMTVDVDKLEGKVVAMPRREDIDTPIAEHLIVELYSIVQTNELFGKFHGVITVNGGQIVSSEDWGLRKPAYPIQKKTTGFYYLIEFEGEGDLVEKLETQYRREIGRAHV